MYETRRLNDKSKVIVTAALTGAVTTKKDNPNLPTQPEEIAASALACCDAGASAVHIHVRDDNDAASMRFDKFEYSGDAKARRQGTYPSLFYKGRVIEIFLRL